MAIKKTLLGIVQDILSDMDSEDVDSVTDTLEAVQVARIVESTYYNIVATRDIPEHSELIKLTALSNSATPTHFSYPENTKRIEHIWYDTSDTGVFEYTEVKWMDPIKFICRQDGLADNYTTVSDLNGGTKLRVANDTHPQYFTSFDDNYIVMDGHKSTVDTTLQESKVRAFGSVIPVFDINDDNYVPDLDGVMFPYLIAEAKSTCFSVLKGGVDQKIEQAARRQKAYVQNDMYQTRRERALSTYGR